MRRGQEGPPHEMQGVKNWLALQAIDEQLGAVRDMYAGNAADQAIATDALASLRVRLQDEARELKAKRRGIWGRLLRRSSPVEDALIKEYTLYQIEQAQQAQLAAQAEADDAKKREGEANILAQRERALQEENSHMLGTEESITDGIGWRIFAPEKGLLFQEKMDTTGIIFSDTSSKIPTNSTALLYLPVGKGETMITVGKRVRIGSGRNVLEIDVRQKKFQGNGGQTELVTQEHYFLAPEKSPLLDVTYNERDELITRENSHGNTQRFFSSIVGFRNVYTNETVYMRFRTQNDNVYRETIEMTQMEIRSQDKLSDFVPA